MSFDFHMYAVAFMDLHMYTYTKINKCKEVFKQQ